MTVYIFFLVHSYVCMIINENDDDCNGDDDDQSAVQLLLPKPQYGAEAKAGFSRLMCSAQKDSKAEIELEG